MARPINGCTKGGKLPHWGWGCSTLSSEELLGTCHQIFLNGRINWRTGIFVVFDLFANTEVECTAKGKQALLQAQDHQKATCAVIQGSTSEF